MTVGGLLHSFVGLVSKKPLNTLRLGTKGWICQCVGFASLLFVASTPLAMLVVSVCLLD